LWSIFVLNSMSNVSIKSRVGYITITVIIQNVSFIVHAKYPRRYEENK